MPHHSRQERRAAARRAAKELRRRFASGAAFVSVADRFDCECAICRAQAAGDRDAIEAAFGDLLARAAAGDPDVFVDVGGCGDDGDRDDDDDGEDGYSRRFDA